MLSSELPSITNRSRYSSDQLIAIIESEIRKLTTSKSTATNNDSRPEDDHETDKANLPVVNHRSFYTLKENVVGDNDVFDQVYFNVSRENIQDISNQQIQKFLEEERNLHLEIARIKSAYSNIFATSNNYPYQNHASCQLVCQFVSFCIVVSGICLLWTCIYCSKPCSTFDDDEDDGQNGIDPTNVPAPIDYSKPYMIKCDSQGSYYASPLNDDEVPPLPSYKKALTCPTHPFPIIQNLSKSVCN